VAFVDGQLLMDFLQFPFVVVYLLEKADRLLIGIYLLEISPLPALSTCYFQEVPSAVVGQIIPCCKLLPI